jgi:hypothetical protein
MAMILVASSGLISAVVLNAAIESMVASRDFCCLHRLRQIDGLLRASQRHHPQPAILARSRQESRMRPYLKAAGMAFSLVAVWATLVQFAA